MTKERVQYLAMQVLLGLLLVVSGVAMKMSEPRKVKRLRAPFLSFPTAQSKLNDTYVTFKGTGTPGTLVEVIANGDVIGSSRIGVDGEWQMGKDLMTPGQFKIQLRAGDLTGARGETSKPVVFRVISVAENRPVQGSGLGGNGLRNDGQTYVAP